MRIIQMLIISLMFVSCSSKYNLGGKYLSEDRTEELILDKNNYIYKNIDNITFPFKCCDTISHGTWTKIIKNNFIELNSAEAYNNNFALLIEVNEQNIDSLKKITFNINNKIEEHYIKHNEKYREILYVIHLNSSDSNLNHIISSKVWDTNKIEFEKPENVFINSFNIEIILKNDIPLSNKGVEELMTFDYTIKNLSSNNFSINIKELSYQYISFERFVNDFAMVYKNEILWNGKKFSKSE